MATLRPLGLDVLARRAFAELERFGSVFDLPVGKGFFGVADCDLSVRHHGVAAASPFGPAAGPHSQLAQNIVLAWLAGGRVIELKTVQANDQLVIPRPCIDVATVGYNVEWSQELTLEESREEYVKAAMLVAMLAASGRLPLAAGFAPTVYDLSVGYDLAGIAGPRVTEFLAGMRDATATVERLRRQIPSELGRLADLPFPTALSSTLTLSTFHGCPPDEIERIVRHLQQVHRLHCTVKLNPVLLGREATHHLLHEVLGYHELRVPETAFTRDATWAQVLDFVGRLGETARAEGLGFGVKFSNTLIVENHRSVFPPSEREMYLSGPPLHVLATQLVARFRAELGDRYPISFAAGADRGNFADLVALGLAPVTVCTDLLKPGGYARGRGYLGSLVERMRAVGARNVDEWVILGGGLDGASAGGNAGGAADQTIADAALVEVAGSDAELLARARSALEARARAAGTAGAVTGRVAEVLHGGGGASERPAAAGGAVAEARRPLAELVGEAVFARWVSAARLRNTAAYAARVLGERRYAAAANATAPRKIGRQLALLDCLNCDKCVPVCPNDANFVFQLAPDELPVLRARPTADGLVVDRDGTLVIAEVQQIGNFADFCNECGNCDTFCPEDGGPYAIKPRFFASEDAFRADRPRDGFHVTRAGGRLVVQARLRGREVRVEVEDGWLAEARAAESAAAPPGEAAGPCVPGPRPGGLVRYEGEGFRLRFRESAPAETLRGEAAGDVDLTLALLVARLGRAVVAQVGHPNYLAYL
jgi:putative selenate reductase